jgi:hypothetical protein
MPTQEELGGDGISLNLFEASLEEGVVRRTNNPAEQIQRMVITDRSPTSPYKIQVLLAACVHGHIDEEKTKPASLILVDYNLNATAAVFTSVGTSFEFSDYQPRDGTGGKNNAAKACPEVVAYAPFKKPKRFNESIVEKSKTTTPSAEFSPQFAGVGAGKIGYSSERTMTNTQRYFDQGMAGRDYDDGERPYRVWWSLTQNRSQNLGISPKLRLAMLVERASYAKFQAVFKIAPRGGPGYTLDELKEKWLRRTTYDDPVIFDPQAPPMLGELEDELIAVEAVKREDNSITGGVFGKLKNGERLEGLSYVWGLAAVETAVQEK